MRRKDREMSEEFALSIVDKCEYAVISMIDKDGKPYSLPISIVRKNNSIYFHSATVGLKIDCLTANNNVCVVCVGDTCRLLNEFSTDYESAIVRGVAYKLENQVEKIEILRLLCERHTPANMAQFAQEIEGSLRGTAVWKIDIESITGKKR